MKKRILLALIAAVMATMMLVTSVSALSVDDFTDKSEFPEWCAPHIAYVAENELMNGVGGNKFAFGMNVSRAQMAVMLYNLETAVNGELEAAAESAFTDIDSVKSWAGAAIDWAAASGIVTGKTATTFDPNADISNAEMAVMIHRYVKYIGVENLLDITRVDSKLVPVEEFQEAFDGEWDGKESDWFRDSAYFVGETALMVGTPNENSPDNPFFYAKNTSNRGQAAIVLTRLHKFLSIPTLEAEMIMENWETTYQNCAHPYNVYTLFSRCGIRDYSSAELNQSNLTAENLQAALETSLGIDTAEWKIEIHDLDEVVKACFGESEIYGKANVQAASGHQIDDVKFTLSSVKDPTIAIDRTLNLFFLQADGYISLNTAAYNTNPVVILPSKWSCGEHRDNYQEEISAYLNDMQAKYLAAVKSADGKIHVAIDPSVLDTYDNTPVVDSATGAVWYSNPLFAGTVARALYYSWVGTGIGGDTAAMLLPTVQNWIYPENPLGDEEYEAFYDAKWGDEIEYAKDDEGNLKYADDDGFVEDPSILETDETTGDVYYENEDGEKVTVEPVVIKRSQGEEVDKLFAALKEYGEYEVTMPLNFRLTNDYNRNAAKNATAENVTFVFETNDDVFYMPDYNRNPAMYAAIVTETSETPSVESLGDFYCPECEQVNLVMGSSWEWGAYDWSFFPAFENMEDFLAYEFKLHAGAHMDVSKWTIVDVVIPEATEKLEGKAHGVLATLDATFYIGKAANAEFEPVAVPVKLDVTKNDHIGGILWDADDNATGITTNRDELGDHFGVCQHSDPSKSSQAMLDAILDEYYCDVHGYVHLNTHDANEVTSDNIISEDKSYIGSLFTGLWSDYRQEFDPNFAEGIVTFEVTSLIKLADEAASVGFVSITLDGHYDDKAATIVFPVKFSADTSVNNTGVVPAKFALTHGGTGETRALCVFTEDYNAWLDELTVYDNEYLDDAIAEFNKNADDNGTVTIYYNSNSVHGSWSPMFAWAITNNLNIVNFDTKLTYIDPETNDYGVDKSIFPNGWYELEDGAVACKDATIEIIFTNTLSGRSTTKSVKVTMISDSGYSEVWENGKYVSGTNTALVPSEKLSGILAGGSEANPDTAK